MNREELINLVKKIQLAEDSEDEIDKLIDLFLKNVPDPNAANYIFEIEYNDLLAEEIVDKSLGYKGLQL